jgi:hypothetical protein
LDRVGDLSTHLDRVGDFWAGSGATLGRVGEI